MPEDTQAPIEKQVTPPPAGAPEVKAAEAVAGTFTQEQVNTFAGKAREEGRHSAQNALLEKFNVKSVDELAGIIEAHRKSEADKLSEVDKVKKELAEAQAKREQLEKENQTLKIQRAFEDTARELNLKFVNDKASADAFALLDLSIVSDKEKGIKAAVKQLFDDRPYLFNKAEAPKTDAAQKGSKSNGALTEDKVAELRKRFRI